MGHIIAELFRQAVERFWRIVDVFHGYSETTIGELTCAPESPVSVVHDGKSHAVVIYPMTNDQVRAVLSCLEENWCIRITSQPAMANAYPWYQPMDDFNPWHQPIRHELEDGQPEWDR